MPSLRVMHTAGCAGESFILYVVKCPLQGRDWDLGGRGDSSQVDVEGEGVLAARIRIDESLQLVSAGCEEGSRLGGSNSRIMKPKDLPVPVHVNLVRG